MESGSCLSVLTVVTWDTILKGDVMQNLGMAGMGASCPEQLPRTAKHSFSMKTNNSGVPPAALYPWNCNSCTSRMNFSSLNKMQLLITQLQVMLNIAFNSTAPSHAEQHFSLLCAKLSDDTDNEQADSRSWHMSVAYLLNQIWQLPLF